MGLARLEARDINKKSPLGLPSAVCFLGISSLTYFPAHVLCESTYSLAMSTNVAFNMDKVSFLTASRVEPSVLPYSTELLFTTLTPLVHSLLHIQRLLSGLSIYLLTQAYTAACITLSTALWSSRFLLINAFFAAQAAFWISRQAIWRTWTSKKVVALRDATFNSFATWILGSGNGLILMLFWPGWWCLAGTTCAIWIFCG